MDSKEHKDLTQAIIDFVEKDKGRKLTAQEINLSLDQARAMGEL
ncbi:MAG: hypothetical protein WBW13_06400 [Pseudolabrys sp.]